MNSCFTRPILPDTRYLINNLFNPGDNLVTFHVTCSICNAYIGRFDRTTGNMVCHVCAANINISCNSYKNFFVTLDVRSEIAELLESYANYYDYVVNERVKEKGVYRYL